MNRNRFINIIVVVFVILAGTVGYLALVKKSSRTTSIPSPSQSKSDWEKCIANPRSKILQAYSRQCVMVDGGKVIEPGQTFSPTPTSAPSPTPAPALPPPALTSSQLQEITLLRNTTVKQVFDTIYDPRIIATNGAIGRNQKGFSDIASQRGATGVILRGIADRDTAMIDKGIAAIEYGFQFQEPAGNFKNAHGLTSLQAISADAFFLQAVGHAALVVQASEYAGQFSSRFVILKPKIDKALNWLASDKGRSELKRQDRNAPNRLVFDALAYTLNGIFLARNDLQGFGDDFITLALARQRADGVFLEGGGHDSSYQATNILNLEGYWLWSNNANLRSKIFSALKTAAAWEKTRINPATGIVSIEGNTRTGSCQEQFFGKCKDINYPEVITSLIYWSVISDDPEAATLALKSLEYATTHLR